MRRDEVVVIGASGFGRESLDVLEAMQEAGYPLRILGVLDDAPSQLNLQRLGDRGVEHLGTVASWSAGWPDGVRYVLGIGNPGVRSELVAALDAERRRAFSAIHPRAVVGRGSSHGEGVVVCAGAVVSTNVRLGRHVHLNPNATIGHDAILEDFVSINPSATISGEVVVRSGTLVGAGAVVLQGLRLGAGAIIGAGAVVTRDVAPAAVAKGVPARCD